ncbi:hypothetical protein DAKH74_040700 [Maudiozyma humilis]|uniref:Uncharacterized protein n=1 Tax=Maudiozyma humilis TaxID=51915 RepID=A0AAV5S428_MAUHU|nr:hypothetical protein DAKH74_040700 [Kazachstania humilis]
MQSLYKQSDNASKSTNSFLRSAPVELTSVKGYDDFQQRYAHAEVSTVLKEDHSIGYVLKNGDVIATVQGAALANLIELSRG